jgi:hypothetical protein
LPQVHWFDILLKFYPDSFCLTLKISPFKIWL